MAKKMKIIDRKGNCENSCVELPNGKTMPLDEFLSLGEGGGESGDKPAEWDIISALDFVNENAEDSKFSKAFWEICKAPLAYLSSRFNLSKEECLFVAVLSNAGNAMSWHDFGRFFDVSRLRVMRFSDALENLVKKRWVINAEARSLGERYMGYKIANGAITAFRENKSFEPPQLNVHGKLQDFVDKIVAKVGRHIPADCEEYKAFMVWLEALLDANQDISLSQFMKNKLDDTENFVFACVLSDYVRFADTLQEGLDLNLFSSVLNDENDSFVLFQSLESGRNELFDYNLIEHKCSEGMADTRTLVLTKNAKEEVLAEYKLSKRKGHGKKELGLLSCKKIMEKTLFYNKREQELVNRIHNMLTVENLPKIQERLKEKKMRTGVAILLSGGPGTGKTELVKQLARETGRDLMQIDLAGIQSKWVGESEENVQAIFKRYKLACKNSKVTPILFINEADGLLGKRMEGAERSVDKMTNTCQNILLQGIEDLEGILVCTTNLTQNLDAAFARRFLVKADFENPTEEVRAKILHSMIPEISMDDARTIASRYVLSGGEIENISRKINIQYVLEGTHPSITDIEKYCGEEIHEKKLLKPIMGFTA